MISERHAAVRAAFGQPGEKLGNVQLGGDIEVWLVKANEKLKYFPAVPLFQIEKLCHGRIVALRIASF
jgi:hypothetical protein